MIVAKNIIQQSKSFTANASNVSTTNNTITISSHGFTTGDAVYYYAASNLIGGLKTDRLYYLISASSAFSAYYNWLNAY